MIDRFVSAIRPAPGGCWEWTKSRDTGGYGSLWRAGCHARASRLAWLYFMGQDPADKWVLHKCDNPACCNPAHLFLGDRRANAWDMVNKGRHNPRRGADKTEAKLTDAKVRAIRKAWPGRVSLSDLAHKYGVSKECVWLAATRRTWRHVT